MDRSRILQRMGVIVALVASVGLASCSTTGPGASTPAAATDGGATAGSSGPTPTEAPASVAPTAEATATPAPVETAAGATTTFTVVLADGPRAGTWEATQTGDLPTCQNDPARDSWNATLLSGPPLSFVDASAANDRDPFFLVKFTDEPDEFNVTPVGDVTFSVDDRGDTATLTWVSEANAGSFFDAQGNKTGDAEVARVELTIECGSVFRFS